MPFWTLKEIEQMTKEEFAENWRNNSIQDSSLKILGRREMTEEERKKQEAEDSKGISL